MELLFKEHLMRTKLAVALWICMVCLACAMLQKHLCMLPAYSSPLLASNRLPVPLTPPPNPPPRPLPAQQPPTTVNGYLGCLPPTTHQNTSCNCESFFCNHLVGNFFENAPHSYDVCHNAQGLEVLMDNVTAVGFTSCALRHNAKLPDLALPGGLPGDAHKPQAGSHHRTPSAGRRAAHCVSSHLACARDC